MEQGLKVKKACKQVRDQRNGVQVLLEMKINPKAFAIPILTAYYHISPKQSEQEKIYFYF